MEMKVDVDWEKSEGCWVDWSVLDNICANLCALTACAWGVCFLHLGNESEFFRFSQDVIQVSPSARTSTAIHSWHLVNFVQCQESQEHHEERDSKIGRAHV